MSQRPTRVIAAAALVLIGAAGESLAHAPPKGTALWWISSPGGTQGGAGGERLVIRTPRGFLFQSGAANDLRFLCNDAVGIQDGEDASFAEGDSGTLLMTTFAQGLLRGSADACRWESVTGITTAPAFDVDPVRGPSGEGHTHLVVGGQPDVGDHFWAGRAGGTWSPLANSDMPYTRVRAAPSDASRIYLTGVSLGATGMAVHRLGVSSDAGRTVVDHVIALGAKDLQARLLGVDPVRPEHVYLRAESISAEIPERLLVSGDGGLSFTPAATLREIQGFAQSDDGRQVWVGGTEGLFRSTDAGETFVGPASGALKNITCLAFHKNRLYGCGVLDKQLVVAVSDDGGDSFKKVFSFEQVTRTVACPDDASARSPATVCAVSLDHWRTEFGTATPDPVTPEPPAPDPGGTGKGGGSGCSVAGARPEPVSLALLFALLIASVSRRRSTRA